MCGDDDDEVDLNFLVHRILVCFYSKKEDWNAIVRKSTISRDPIGSTRNSLTRKDKRSSLRRQILEQANQGLQMDTEKIVGK